MSCYEWEAGELILPTVAIKPLRDQLNKAHNARRTAVMAAAKTVSATLRATRGTKADDRYFLVGRAVTAGAKLREDDLLHQDVVDVLYRTWTPTGAKSGTGRFRAVTGADLDAVIGPLGTNRTTSWNVGTEATITLFGRNVRWDVPENNRAVDHAHRHPMAVAFFAALDKITWTRGTGGDLVGNNEYSRDNQDAGGGANYVTHTYSAEATRQRQAVARVQARPSRNWNW